jgi:hypothetical protein
LYGLFGLKKNKAFHNCQEYKENEKKKKKKKKKKKNLKKKNPNKKPWDLLGITHFQNC